MEKFIVFGNYCEDAICRREPFRKEHLDRLRNLKDTNIVILDPPNITKHGYLERKKFLEDFETIIASKAVFLDGGISFAQKIKINRSTGKTVFDTFEKGSPMVFDHLNCSKETVGVCKYLIK